MFKNREKPGTEKPGKNRGHNTYFFTFRGRPGFIGRKHLPVIASRFEMKISSPTGLPRSSSSSNPILQFFFPIT